MTTQIELMRFRSAFNKLITKSVFHVTSQVVGSNMFYTTIQKMGIVGVDEVDIHASILSKGRRDYRMTPKWTISRPS